MLRRCWFRQDPIARPDERVGQFVVERVLWWQDQMPTCDECLSTYAVGLGPPSRSGRFLLYRMGRFVANLATWTPPSLQAQMLAPRPQGGAVSVPVYRDVKPSWYPSHRRTE